LLEISIDKIIETFTLTSGHCTHKTQFLDFTN
jgi:hypothetical protein